MQTHEPRRHLSGWRWPRGLFSADGSGRQGALHGLVGGAGFSRFLPLASGAGESRTTGGPRQPFFADSGAWNPGEPEVGQVGAVGVVTGLVQARSLLAVGHQGESLLLLVTQHHDGQGLSAAVL